MAKKFDPSTVAQQVRAAVEQLPPPAGMFGGRPAPSQLPSQVPEDPWKDAIVPSWAVPVAGIVGIAVVGGLIYYFTRG